jgi:hypothetical protein
MSFLLAEYKMIAVLCFGKFYGFVVRKFSGMVGDASLNIVDEYFIAAFGIRIGNYCDCNGHGLYPPLCPLAFIVASVSWG